MFVPIPTCSKVIPTFLADPVSPSRLSLSLFIVPPLSCLRITPSKRVILQSCAVSADSGLRRRRLEHPPSPTRGRKKEKEIREVTAPRRLSYPWCERGMERRRNLQTCSPTWPHQQFSRLTDTAQDVWSDERGATGKVSLHAGTAMPTWSPWSVARSDQSCQGRARERRRADTELAILNHALVY